jgi:adenosylhomocysteinase
MSLTAEEMKNLSSPLDFKVRDLSLADWGRKEIEIAEKEMPGLMSVRESIARTASQGFRIPGLYI